MTNDEEKYIEELETNYNLLFDYMWSMGTVPYMKYLKDRKILNNKNYKKHTTRRKFNIHKLMEKNGDYNTGGPKDD